MKAIMFDIFLVFFSFSVRVGMSQNISPVGLRIDLVVAFAL